jgi:hypothetical protein
MTSIRRSWPSRCPDGHGVAPALYKVRVTLNDAPCHHADSTEIALREAGRDAWHKVVKRIGADSLAADYYSIFTQGI